jgi:chemotaxis protein MotB
MFTLAAGSLTSCVSKKKFDELAAAKAATDQALAETQTQLKNLQSEKDALAAEYASEKTRMNTELGNLRTDLNNTKSQMTQMNEKLNMTEAELNKLKAELNGLFASYQAAGLAMESRDGRLYLVTDSPVTYSSGSSRLDRAERNAIDALAAKLKTNPNIRIVVEGHTDNKQFASGAGTDNWDLSYARAKAVASRLIRQGVNPAQVAVAGYGEYRPATDNNTSEGRARNRRSVVAPNPDLGNLKRN